MSAPSLLRSRLPVFLHVAAWVIIFILPFYLLSMNSVFDINFLYRIYSHTVVYMLLFYINFVWLVPRFFFKGRKLAYLASLLALLVVSYFLVEVTNEYILPSNPPNPVFEAKLGKLMDENNIKPPSRNIHIYNYLLNAVLVCGFSLGLRISEKYLQNEKEKKELEKEKLNSELAFLKNQISPHFFFNTLNNIYSLIQINTADAQQSVLKLSKLMRYLLYESEQGDTLLSREIDFMNNYVDLMRLRLSSKVDLRVSFPAEYTDFTISPLLYVSFIENAFKHGVSYQGKSFIHISLETTASQVLFSCVNSAGKPGNIPDDSSGIGLENVRKRLSLLYPGSHSLEIARDADVFSVKLSLTNLRSATV